jgi:hypothetical protein
VEDVGEKYHAIYGFSRFPACLMYGVSRQASVPFRGVGSAAAQTGGQPLALQHSVMGKEKKKGKGKGDKAVKKAEKKAKQEQKAKKVGQGVWCGLGPEARVIRDGGCVRTQCHTRRPRARSCTESCQGW